MRVALVLSDALANVGSAVRSIPGCEVVLEVAALTADNAQVLATLPAPPDVVVLSEDMAAAEGSSLSITGFVQAVQRHNPRIRVIFIVTQSQPGDELLADLVRLGITDFIDARKFSQAELAKKLEQQTPFSEVSYLLEADLPVFEESSEGRRGLFSGFGRRSGGGGGGQAPAAPQPRTVVVERVVERVVEKVVEAPSQARNAVTVVFGLGPTGVGVSTVAINVAFAYASNKGKKIALVDLDPMWSAIPLLLGLEESDGVTALIRGAKLEECVMVKRGVSVVASLPYPNPPRSRSLAESDVLLLADRLATFDYLVVDAGHQPDHAVVKALLRLADRVLLVADLDPNHALIGMSKMDALRDTVNPEKLQLVVNWVPQNAKTAKASEVAQVFGFKKDSIVQLPYAPQMADAVAQGEPLQVLAGPDDPFVAGIRAAAGAVQQQTARRGWWPFS